MDQDKYEDLADQLTPPARRPGGKRRSNTSKTPGKAIQRAVANSQENRIERAKSVLIKDLTHFPFVKDSVEQNLPAMELYTRWLFDSLDQGKLIVKEGEYKYKATHSSKPGGQNVNKRLTAMTATHTITGLYQRSETQSEQNQNKDNATTLLNTELLIHLETAEEFVSDMPTPESKHEKVMELLSEMLASKFPETSKVESEKV